MLALIYWPVGSVLCVQPLSFARRTNPPFGSKDQAAHAAHPDFVIAHPACAFVELLREFVLEVREPAKHPSIGAFSLEGRHSKLFGSHVRVPVCYPLSFRSNYVHQLSLEQETKRVVRILDEEWRLPIRPVPDTSPIEVV